MRQVPDLARSFDPAKAAWRGAEALGVAGITCDSREVHPGDLFVAIPGEAQDGRAFIAEAVARGAAAVLAPNGTDWPPGVPPRPLIEDPEPRRRLAQLAAVMAGPQPAIMVAVTGTNGKTSTVEFLRQLWSLSGYAAASLGTLGLNAPGFAAGLRPDDAGPGHPRPDPGPPRPRRSAARGDGSLLARARSVPARRRPPDRRRVHQSHARPSRLSWRDGCVQAGQAAPVRRPATVGGARRGEQRAGSGKPERARATSHASAASICAPSARTAPRSACCAPFPGQPARRSK